MVILYKYLFYKVYFFYVNVFKEKEIPHWFAASVITVILVVNIVIVIDTLLYLINPELIKSINLYYKYFALFVLLCIMLFINYKDKYKQIIDTCEKLTKRKRKILSYISVLYILTLFIYFVWLAQLIREFHKQ